MYPPSCPEVEILSSFARDLCSTAQNFVCTSRSSIQRSEQSVFIVPLQLPSSTTRNPFTTGSPTESSVSSSLWTKVQWECVHFSSCFQHFRPFKPPRTTGGTDTQNLQVKMSFAEVSHVCSQPSCPTELQSSVPPNSRSRSVRQDSVHRESMTCEWCKHVPFALIPEFPSLSLISSFQDLRYQFAMF